MEKRNQRTALLIGEDALKELSNKKILVFGVGGVGGFIVEALIRAGVGNITMVDDDVVDETNINRQLIALYSTIGKSKVEVFCQRAKDVNPDIIIKGIQKRLTVENIDQFELEQYDYIVDAIDTISSKIALAEFCDHYHLPLIAAMGAGNKLDPSRFEVADIYDTSVCPLAKVMRTELRKRKVKKLKVVYSKEVAKKTGMEATERRKFSPGSISFVPSAMGLLMAKEIIWDCIHWIDKE